MPKLSDDKRKSIAERQAVTERIRKSFEGMQYTAQCCRFCNWASNGLTLDEARKANREHERIHPEQAEFDANLLSISEIPQMLHDHDCDMQKCSCKCGCQDGPFCILVFGPLCSYCAVRDIRGDDAHGEQEAHHDH